MAEEEKVYVSNATNPLKKVMMCSPRYYQFNGINVITAEWMKKGDQEKNDVMVAEWQMLVDAFKDNGIEVVEVEARPEFEVMTFARDYGCMIKEGAVTVPTKPAWTTCATSCRSSATPWWACRARRTTCISI